MSTAGYTGSQSPSISDTLASQDLKAHACVLCQKRKVKCDRRHPCAACTKSRAKCVFQSPALPRRRPRKSPEAILLAKVRRYEELLKGFGVNIESTSSEAEMIRRVENMGIVSDSSATELPKNPSQAFIRSTHHRLPLVEEGKIIVRNGKTRYLEK